LKCAELKASTVVAENINDSDEKDKSGKTLADGEVRLNLHYGDKIESALLQKGFGSNRAFGTAMRKGQNTLFAVPDSLRSRLASMSVSMLRTKELSLLADIEPKATNEKTREILKKFNAKQLLMATAQEIGEIVIENGDKTIKFQNKKIFWQCVTPETFFADVDLILGLIQQIRDLRAVGFAQSDKKSFSNPKRILLYDKDGHIISGITIGGRYSRNSFYAKADGFSGDFVISPTLFRIVKMPWYKWSMRAICSFDLKDPVRLTIRRSDGKYEYRRTVGDAWQMSYPQTLPADARRLYLGPFSKSRGLGEFIALDIAGPASANLSKYGLDKPYMTVECEYAYPDFIRGKKKEKNIICKLAFGKLFKYKGKNCRYMKSDGHKVIFIVPGSISELFEKDYKDMR
jgi:hypothetical protein